MKTINKRYGNLFKPGNIFIFKEKHGDRYFDASSVAQAGKVCRKILKERHGVYWQKADEIKDPKPLEMTEEQIEALPEGSETKRTAQQEYKQWKIEKRQVEEDKIFCEAVEETLKTKSDYAIDLVFFRRDYEYEELYVEKLESVEEENNEE